MESLLTSLNFLDHPALSREVDHEQLHPESPLAIKSNLKLDELQEGLFPSLVTGVRWWPFLCLAGQFKSDADYQNIFSATKRLKRDLETKARLGPLTKSSFRPYLSMAENIDSDSNCSKLNGFLNKLTFAGDAKFFHQYKRTESWKRLFLKANGSPGIGYVRAYRHAVKQCKDPSPIDVITLILANPPSKFDKLLWRGCYSFVFLRCLFGSFDRQDGEPVSYSEYVLPWRDKLIEIMQSDTPGIPVTACNPAYIELLRKIEDRNSPPPLAAQAKLFRSEERPILAALKIPLFHNLYFKPMPRALVA